MSVMTNGWGSREKSRVAVKRTPHVPKLDDNPLALSIPGVDSEDEDIVDAKPLAVASGTPLQIAAAPKRNIVRLDLVLIFSLVCIIFLPWQFQFSFGKIMITPVTISLNTEPNLVVLKFYSVLWKQLYKYCIWYTQSKFPGTN